MAGEARSESFVLGSATVMIGPQASLYQLNPDAHSIGLTKNFTCIGEPNYLDLTQGAKATIVYQVLTANSVKANCEVFEYTSKNFSYSLGLTPSLLLKGLPFALATAVVGSDTVPVVSMTFNGSPVAPVIPAGTWLSVQHPVDKDNVHYAQTSADSVNLAGSITVALRASQGFGTGNNFPVGAVVNTVNSLPIGNKQEQPFFGVKVTGVLPKDDQPVSMYFPKVRITKGFSVTFGETAFGNLPFQFTPFELIRTDLYYDEYHGQGYGKIMMGT